MGAVVDLGAAGRIRPAERRSTWGLVTRLVDAQARPRRRRQGVVSMDGVATMCLLDELPAIGDLIHGHVPGVVEKVRVTRAGRVLIDARAAGEVGSEVRPDALRERVSGHRANPR